MNGEARILHVVRSGADPERAAPAPESGDTVFLLDGRVDGEELERAAEDLLDLVFEHDVVVTW